MVRLSTDIRFFRVRGIYLNAWNSVTKMIKMLIAPIVFMTIVIVFANMGDMKKIGRIKLK
jgi:aerobic C4-dicarboxylate transport protein